MKMANWRRQKSESYYKHESQRARSYNRPNDDDGPCLLTDVPLWEKEFCSSLRSVTWRKLLEVKKYIHLYSNVHEWNDSAGEEAFYNAKYRFWAKINGQHCEISLPDPDIYIDKIEWNSDMDPELYLDLERARIIAKQHSKDAILAADLLLLNQPIVPTGWGMIKKKIKDKLQIFCLGRTRLRYKQPFCLYGTNNFFFFEPMRKVHVNIFVT